MLTNLKSFITVVVTGTGLIGAPVTLWQTNVFTTSQLEIKTITKILDSRTIQTTYNSGNCDIEKLSDDNKRFLLSQNQGGNFYVQVSCTNTNEGDGLGAITTHSWTGLFPVELLKNGTNLSIGQEIEIKTKDVTQGEITKTAFKGKGIKEESITGTWISQSPIILSFPEDINVKGKLYVFSN